MSPAAAYARFRGSAWFVWLLTVFLAGWFTAHWITGFDHGYGVLNVILSSEASLSVALLIMATEKQDEAQRKQLVYMLQIMEAMHEQMVESAMARRGTALVAPGPAVATEGAKDGDGEAVPRRR